MSNYASKVIEVAESQVGYLEKKSASDLDSKTANAGYNNYTKYARDLRKEIGTPFIDGYAWCCTFVEWCFVEAYGITQAKKLLGVWTAYCPTLVQQFRVMGEWFTNSPKVGDVIFFRDSDGTAGHVGIVYKVDSSYVYTIEGNTSPDSGVVPNGGGVHKKSYSLTYSRILGYGRPNYTVKKVKPKKYSGSFPIVPPILRNGSQGTQVKRLQKFLNWYGKYGLDVDGIFGAKTERAVKDFQQDVFHNKPAEWDGEVGSKTVAKMKKVKK